jgi:hypothetical protein
VGGRPLDDDDVLADNLKGAMEFGAEDVPPPARGFDSAALYAYRPTEREDIDDLSCLLLDILLYNINARW